MDRRQFLATSATGVTVTTVGCSGGSDGSESPNTTESNESQSDETSNSTSSEGEPEFEIETNAPTTGDLERSITIEVEVSNTGEAGGDWTGELAVTSTRGPEPDTEPNQWETIDVEVYDVSPSESRVWDTDRIINGPSVIYYRLNERPVQSIAVPESREPIIETVNLVTEWNSYGDTIDNEIEEAEVGSWINVSSRYWYWTENQSIEVFRQVEIYNEDNVRVERNTATSELVREYNGWSSWESNMPFNTTDWDSGTYTAEVLLRDEQNQEVSEKNSVEFELV
jgi:hypothetical protein